MICPACSISLKRVKASSDLVNICPQCKGIWFDQGEFSEFIRELTESKEISPRTPQLFIPQTFQAVDPVVQRDRDCPRCGEEMQKFNYEGDSNVFLDKCPSCRGLWADGGEVRGIAQ